MTRRQTKIALFALSFLDAHLEGIAEDKLFETLEEEPSPTEGEIQEVMREIELGYVSG